VTASNIDFVNSYPTFITGSLATIPNYLAFSDRLNRFVSYFANAAYTYNNKYTISASGRRDASNLFGVKTNEKWTPLWSGGISWDISGEQFYKFSYLPYLRFRLTYGFSGNADQTKSALTILRNGGTGMYTNFQALLVDQNANPQLRWERVKTFNTGLDFGARDNTISGSIEYYRKEGIDLFGTSPVDYTALNNVNYLIKNVSNMRGSGVDISVKSNNIHSINAGFKWTTTFLFNYSRSITTKFYRSSSTASTFISNGDNISAIEGKTLYSIISYKWMGLDHTTGNPQGIFNGSVSTDYVAITGAKTGLQDLVYGGPALPQYFGSLSNSFSWKGITLNFNIVYQLD
jgi:TonB-dependent starch-binding outer membrane protein SusC